MEEGKFERMILGMYVEGDRLKELQKKALNKGLRGDEVYEFIHLDRYELVQKISKLEKQIDKVAEVFERVCKCDCKYTDEGGNCTDCLNHRFMPDCELSGEVFNQFYIGDSGE